MERLSFTKNVKETFSHFYAFCKRHHLGIMACSPDCYRTQLWRWLSGISFYGNCCYVWILYCDGNLPVLRSHEDKELPPGSTGSRFNQQYCSYRIIFYKRRWKSLHRPGSYRYRRCHPLYHCRYSHLYFLL